MEELNKIPDDVYHVKFIQHCGQPVGSETYNWCQEVISKNPQHFPWEHKYKSIPQEVHDAYYLERNGESREDQMNRIFKRPQFEEGKGIRSTIVTIPPNPPLNWDDLVQALKDSHKRELDQIEKARKDRIEHKKIWDKHYKPYGLEFRENKYDY